MRLGPILLSFPGPWRIPVLLLAMGLGLVLGVLAWRRKVRSNRLGRLIATELAIACLILVAIEPQWLTRQSGVDAVLLTSGATLDEAVATSTSLPGRPRILGLGDAVGATGSVRWSPDVAALRRTFPEVSLLHVIGHGLSAAEWDELDGVRTDFRPSALTPGIAHLSWQRQLVLGQELVVQGEWVGLASKIRLSLRDPSGASDSVELQPGTQTKFELHATPRATGRFLYRVQSETAPNQVVSEETVDVSVTEPPRVDVLWVESVPRFEVKFFRDWLAARGSTLVVRSTISRDRVREEFANRSKSAFGAMDPQTLEPFDLVVADGRALEALQPAEREALSAAVRSGLGLLVLADARVTPTTESQASDLAGLLPWKLSPIGDLESRRAALNWPGADRQGTSPLPVEPLEIQLDSLTKPLIADSQGRVMAALKRFGRGAVALTLEKDTHQWVLEGNADTHAAYWSYLLRQLARPARPLDLPTLPAAGPVLVDEPLALRLLSEAQHPELRVEASSGDTSDLALSQDFREPTRWHATYWPKRTGWHRVLSTAGADTWFYAQEPTGWKTWQQALRVDESTRRASQGSSFGAVDRDYRRPEPIPPAFFFLGFLLFAGYLWIEDRTG